MKKRALITGINGMDGSHLADFLLEKGYEVFGMERRTSTPNRTNSWHLEDKITFLITFFQSECNTLNSQTSIEKWYSNYEFPKYSFPDFCSQSLRSVSTSFGPSAFTGATKKQK